MKTYKYCDAPIEVHGLPFWNETHKLERIPDSDIGKFPKLGFLGKRCAGARIKFRTNSPSFKIKMELKTLKPDVGMSIFACQSIVVMLGSGQNDYFYGLLSPNSYDMKTVEKTFKKSPSMEDVTLWLPRNEHIEDIEIEIEDDAKIESPTPYAHGPVLYYGSSITEGGCCTLPINAYNAVVSNELNCDFYNYGFSASAFGEIEMAELICRTDMKVFVMDYDHNAPTLEHLKETHEPFFKYIRERKPNLPIIIASAPVYSKNAGKERAEVIYNTYRNAVDAGDKLVWFIDGREYFGNMAKRCSVDSCHPNDLGFDLMAKKFKPVVEEALRIAEKTT